MLEHVYLFFKCGFIQTVKCDVIVIIIIVITSLKLVFRPKDIWCCDYRIPLSSP